MEPGWERSIRYEEWASQAWSGVREDGPADLFPWEPPGSELDWQSWWFSGAFGREFVSTRGQGVRVLQFGHWNRGAGPDFTNAAVEVDGQLRVGSIELDREARDWERHGHGENPDFAGVVLHVHGSGREREERFTRTCEHREVTQVELTPEMFRSVPGSPGGTAEARRGRCAPVFRELPRPALEDLLRCAAERRLSRKAERMETVAAAHGMEQAHYQGIAETLGYRSNQSSMRVLAQRFPVAEAMELPLRKREALLFGLAGFLGTEQFDEGDGAARDYLKGLWQEWWKLRGDAPTAREIPWRLSGVRPANHPQRRVAALAAWLERWKDWKKILPGLGTPAGDWDKAVRSRIQELHHPYWDHHYTLRSKPSKSRLALIGEDRAVDWLGNWLFPLAVRQDPAQWATYERLRGSQASEALRRARQRILVDREDAEDLTGFYWQQQGLLQVYEDFCLRDASDCVDCPMPEQVLQWG